jgi:acetyl esterase/lipase
MKKAAMADAQMTRRALLAGMGYTAGALAMASCAGSAPREPDPTAGKLAFDPAVFTQKTATVATAAGDKQVTYHFFGPITYVANPVDADYQSLVISVPTAIDGRAVDATGAPIVFANSVGGYLPASVKDVTGVGEAGRRGPPPPGLPGGEVTPGGNAMVDARGDLVNLAALAVAAGYVAVEPGCRGRTLVTADGVCYGTAPAAVVDLKAAVRYLRSNAATMPGDTDRIVSTGTSAGGALSALLGASGDSPLYAGYLDDLGAADAGDAIYASGAWCPITDLEHADGAYEWNWGANRLSTGGQVDREVSAALGAQFAEYLKAAEIHGLNDFGVLNAANYPDYLLEHSLQPAATTYLTNLTEHDRAGYLAQNPFITWTAGEATFDWAGFVGHVGTRRKTAPAFDAFDLSTAENNLFGAGTVAARHFTGYSAARNTDGAVPLAAGIPELCDLMNPMYHLSRAEAAVAPHWWIRVGTSDTDTSLSVSANLAAAAAAAGASVSHRMYWDEGHGANPDAAEFITWIDRISR